MSERRGQQPVMSVYLFKQLGIIIDINCNYIQGINIYTQLKRLKSDNYSDVLYGI